MADACYVGGCRQDQAQVQQTIVALLEHVSQGLEVEGALPTEQRFKVSSTRPMRRGWRGAGRMADCSPACGCALGAGDEGRGVVQGEAAGELAGDHGQADRGEEQAHPGEEEEA